MIRTLLDSLSKYALALRRTPAAEDPIQRWEAERLESLEYHRRNEKERNEDTRLPEGETVHLPCIWISEVYLASHIPRLIQGLERHPENVAALQGYVWLDTPGKVLHVEASRLEFREDAPA